MAICKSTQKMKNISGVFKIIHTSLKTTKENKKSPKNSTMHW